jgi:biotin carboxyl carrier protein
MPGKVVGIAVEQDTTVVRGQVLVVIEAMKMEHSVRAPIDGVVSSVKVAPGDQVEADQVLAVVTDLEAR